MQPMRNFFALKSKLFRKKFAHMHFLLYLCTLFRVLGSQVALLRGRMMAEEIFRTIGTFRTFGTFETP
jgi:hypothetical protein